MLIGFGKRKVHTQVFKTHLSTQYVAEVRRNEREAQKRELQRRR